MGGKAYKVVEKLAEVLELPKDIILDISKIIVIGTDSFTIENHKGIVTYCDNKISINTGIGVITIIGKDLIIKSILEEEIIIKGQLSSIEF
ncbi:MAG: sporulation protein YqfC [Firmicutes bacterium]|nr:sporulation protein YqfC [Bacillota bacterium]